MKQVTFIKNLVKDRNIAAIAPTSNRAVKKICSKINFDKDITVVEFGPGDGVLTKVILARMSKDSRFIGIETNKAFVEELNGLQDLRLTVVEDDARNVLAILDRLGISDVDYVISSIPFTFFSPQVRSTLVKQTHKALSQSGVFIVYQYSALMKKHLENSFPAVYLEFAPVQVPPIFIMRAHK
ncbi:MAG: hypothetical protein O2794_04240 [bacterium]|nr:hypothetical protein [bacterium]